MFVLAQFIMCLQAAGGVRQWPPVDREGTQDSLTSSHNICYFEPTTIGGSVGHILRRNYDDVEGRRVVVFMLML